MHTITIIGGGASGSLLLINMLKYYDDSDIVIKWIEQSGEFGIGVAYSTDKDYHILNVPANSMGLYHDYANDFFEWLLKKEYAYSEHDYVPRKIYGDYIKENLFHYLKNNHRIQLELIQAEVIDIDIVNQQEQFNGKSRYKLHLQNGKTINADTVILATGNFLPSNPKVQNMDYVNSERYYRNSWDNETINSIRKTDDVLIIGTGLTMVDKILDLYHQNHKGKIFAISRNGYLPFTHNPCSRHQKYPDYTNEILGAKKVKEIFDIIRKHIDIGIKSGIDWRVVLDTIRPSLPAIWDSLSLQEKKTFYRRLGSIWTVVRHRIPVLCADIIHLLKDKRQLSILSGRLQEINSIEKGFSVIYSDRKTKEKTELEVQRIINCTGPQLNLANIESTLFRNLLQKEIINIDELALGLDALPDGTLLSKDKKEMSSFYTIGNGLKGILFESTAIPEIRLQAYQLTQKIMKEYASSNQKILV